MGTTDLRPHQLAGLYAVLTRALAAAGAGTLDIGLAAAASRSTAVTIVRIDAGVIRGATGSDGYESRGLAYAAPRRATCAGALRTGVSDAHHCFFRAAPLVP